MSSITDDLKAAIKYLEPLLLAVEMAQGLTGVGGPGAAEALAAADAMLRRVLGGMPEKADVTAILADLKTLTGGLQGNDAAADFEELQRFPPEPLPP